MNSLKIIALVAITATPQALFGMKRLPQSPAENLCSKKIVEPGSKRTSATPAKSYQQAMVYEVSEDGASDAHYLSINQTSRKYVESLTKEEERFKNTQDDQSKITALTALIDLIELDCCQLEQALHAIVHKQVAFHAYNLETKKIKNRHDRRHLKAIRDAVKQLAPSLKASNDPRLSVVGGHIERECCALIERTQKIKSRIEEISESMPFDIFE